MKWSSAAVALIVIALWGWAWIQTEHSDALADRLAQSTAATAVIDMESEMAVLTTTWYYKPDPEGACLTHTVSTTQQQGETPAEHTARHAEAVRLALAGGFGPAMPQSECN